MNPQRRKYVLFPLLVFLMACPIATILSYVTTALQIAEAAAGITGAVPAQYVTYVAAALTGITCASTELATNDNTAQKYFKVTNCFVGVVEPNLPPGTAQNIVASMEKLSDAIYNILQNLPKPNDASLKKATKPMRPEDQARFLALASKAEADRVKFLEAHK